ncbi:MAG: ATP-binding protein [Melioribacteraceae bacterium]|nr:ATP-binding protein [Saprospiraceae bacterium]MCF8356412.1 ATP-binding protein [Melioribacteraceae bacterium]MCF8396399.1 ATP-binding protein [Melioribacteraceae bacterium]
MKKNPFKFGSIVDEPYFTNRSEEIKKVKSILSSDNHLIIISPRRFGKTSLISKVIKEIDRPAIFLDLQLITNTEDFAAQLLKRVYRVYPFEKIKQIIKSFRIIPNISLNPMNNEVDISFQSVTSVSILIEDVLNLIERVSDKKKKLIVIFDEFQEIKNIEMGLDRQIRSTIQHHQNINYVFLGSQESLMRDIFEKKKSPFYHFGYLLPLDKIPHQEFMAYLASGLETVIVKSEEIAKKILEITRLHPYYTQQLAFTVWDSLNNTGRMKNPVEEAVDEIIRHHDMDYERLWNTINRTDMKILIGMSLSELTPLSSEFSKKYFAGASSTIFSSLKRLAQSGLVIKTELGYEIDDPFFKRWVNKRRIR